MKVIVEVPVVEAVVATDGLDSSAAACSFDRAKVTSGSVYTAACKTTTQARQTKKRIPSSCAHPNTGDDHCDAGHDGERRKELDR